MTQPAAARVRGATAGPGAPGASSSAGAPGPGTDAVLDQLGAPEGEAGRGREVLVLVEDLAQRARVTAALSGRYDVARPERLLDWVRARRPHVLLVTDDGERAARARRVVAEVAPEAGYVVLVAEPTPERYRTLLATCTAVLPASSPEPDLVLAVAGAWRALTCLPLAAARMLSGAHGAGPRAVLSARDIVWLRALADGVTVGSLARTAGYSQREMYRLLAALYARLGADTRTEALLRADRAGLLTTDPPVPTGRGADHLQGAGS
jgi:DNA-binding NarL/FixJ family response regulator